MTSLDLGNLTPGDAVAALRSFPRRFGELLQPSPEAEPGVDPDERAARPGPGGTSALDVVARVLGAWEGLGRALHQVVVNDAPEVDLSPSPTRPEPTVAGAVTDLEAASASLATQIEGVPGDSWSRSGTVAGGTTTALGIVREAVSTGRQGLDQVEEILAALEA